MRCTPYLLNINTTELHLKGIPPHTHTQFISLLQSSDCSYAINGKPTLVFDSYMVAPPRYFSTTGKYYPF